MMRVLVLAIALIAASPALAQTPGFFYLLEPDMATCTARSVQEGVAMGVTDGSPWWYCVAINGQVYLAIETAPRATGYDFTQSPVAILGPNAGQATGLTAPEIAALVPSASLSTQQENP